MGKAKKKKRRKDAPVPWRRLFAGTVVAGLLASSVFLWHSRRSPSGSFQSIPEGLLRGHNLLLVTIDTLRADVLGVYGDPHGLTPNLDRLAREGIRFTSAFAHATMTLPSHASILTGEYPVRHGIRDNGFFRLEDSRLTLAEILEPAGYRSGAFVGAFVLDTRFGLGQGFDLYDDDYGEESSSTDFNFVERSADEVLVPARAWIEQQEGQPWFAWVHLFDPHVPYQPPGPFRDRDPDQPYRGEVAYTDHALGKFLDRLRSAGQLENTLLVVTADHGESRGEHGETTHGAFAYNATLRVPLIFWSVPELEPQVFTQAVGHVDIVPTVLELLGLPSRDSVQGSTLLPRLAGRQAEGNPIYFETLHGYLTQNLAPLTGIIEREYKFIDLPIPELYHLLSDPGEQRNLFSSETARARELQNLLEERVRTWTSGSDQAVQPTSLDAETRQRLQALGYVSSFSPPSRTTFTAADDPKSVIGLIEKQRAAMTSYALGKPEEAISHLSDVIEERPDFTVAYLNVATILHAAGRLAEAIATLDRAASLNPERVGVMAMLGAYLSDAGELERAVSILEGAIEMAPDNVDVVNSLAIAYARLGKLDDALALFERVLELDPSSAATLNNIGTTYLRKRDFAAAIATLRRVIDRAPDFWLAYDGLGAAFAETGRLPEAVEAWKRLVELNPESYDALYNLGLVLAEQERDPEALIYLERFARDAPPDVYAADIKSVNALAANVRQRLR